MSLIVSRKTLSVPPNWLHRRQLDRKLYWERVSVNDAKISPPFIKTAGYMIQSGRVSFQDLVVCVLHCLQHLTATRGKVLAPNDDLSVKQICYEIAFSVLKYRAVILEVLNESGFWVTFHGLKELHQLVSILTYIQYIIAEPLPKDNVYHSEIRAILRALFVHKIHVDASFARSRIKLNATTVIHLLPKEDREEYVNSTKANENAPPYYARVNKIKNSTNDVIGSLQEHFTFYPNKPTKEELKKTPGFYRDSDFKDLLVFDSSLREELTGFPILKDSGLVLQERVLSYVISTLQGLIVRGYDIVQTHSGSGSLSTYLSSILTGNKVKLRVCGCNPGDVPHLQRNISRQGIKNTELTSSSFLDYQIPEKPAVQCIVCTPPSTMSGVKEPFRYALYEGDYSVAGEKVKKQQGSLRQFVVHQTKTLRHALSYPKVSTVIYFTLSNNFQENEGIVRNCLEEYNEKCENPAHRFMSIPVLPSVRKEMLENTDPHAERPPTGEFFKTIDAHPGSAGGFISVLYRKMPDDIKVPHPEETSNANVARITSNSTVTSSGSSGSTLLPAVKTFSSSLSTTPAAGPGVTRSTTSNSTVLSRGTMSSSSAASFSKEGTLYSTGGTGGGTGGGHHKKKKKHHSKVVMMDGDAAPVIGDFSKLALIEHAPSLQAFKKEFIHKYEMVMGAGSRAKLQNKVKAMKPKKEPESVAPKVSLVITKAMEYRKREKVKPVIHHQQVILHPHPFK